MYKILIVLIMLIPSILFANNADKVCKEYKEVANSYYVKAQNNDYLSARYMELYRLFNTKYEKCLHDYKQGLDYKGYKINPNQEK